MNQRETDLLAIAEMNAANSHRHEVECRILEIENAALEEEIKRLTVLLREAEESHESLTARVIKELVGD